MHEVFLISGGSTIPTSIVRMILMASQHDMESGLDPSAPVNMQSGVVCIQHRTLEEHARDNEELKAIVMM